MFKATFKYYLFAGAGFTTGACLVITGLDEAIKEFIETVKDCVEEIHYPHKDVLKAARAYAKLQDGEAIARAEKKGG